MSEDRPWEGDEPPGRPDLSFPPGPTALAVFLAVAAPVVFAGIAIGVRGGGDPLTGVMVAGVVLGLAAAVAAYAALVRAARRR